MAIDTTAAEQQAKEEWAFAENVMGHESARAVYIYGPPGIGKTFVACRTGLGERGVYVITLTPETPAAEMRGFWVPKGGEFVWQDGPFIRAMREGARVVVNEISHASSDVMALLHPVLESKKTAQLTLPNLETIIPAEGFQVICTDNLAPDQLPDALADRFQSTLYVERPHPDALASLDEKFRKAAVKSSAISDGRNVSIRGWLAVQEFEKTMGLDDAFRAAFGAERGEQLKRALTLANR